MNIKLSIVTVVYNDSKGLESTILSKIDNDHSKLEYIIIDGASNDDTLQIINKYSSHIDNWISEKDEGIYDAMTKGINMTSGSHILLLNAGDVLINGAIDKVIPKLKRNISLISNVYQYKGNVDVGITVMRNKPYLMRLWNHQNMLITREFYQKYEFDKRLNVSADLDHKLLIWRSGKYELINEVIVESEPEGVSKNSMTFRKWLSRSREKWIIANKHFPFYWAVILFVLHSFRLSLKIKI